MSSDHRSRTSYDPLINYAGFWRRLAANLLDGVLYFSFITPFVYLFNSFFFSARNIFDIELIVVVLVIYLWVHNGATPGKCLMECKVVDAATRRPISWRQAGLRFIAYLASILSLCVGFLWIIWDKHKQGFHDKIAGTVVIRYTDDYEYKSLTQLMSDVQ